MRSFTDEEGKVGWIFNEYTHPRGLYYNQPKPEEVKVEEVKQEVEEVKVEEAKPKKVFKKSRG